MAGYSGTPLARKLGIKPGARLVLVGAPEEMPAWLAPLPEQVEIGRPGAGAGNRAADVIVFFTREAAQLEAEFPALARALKPAGGLWLAWPKKSAKVPTGLSDTVVRKIGLAGGLVDNKVCAISETGSGLRFVYRLKDRK